MADRTIRTYIQVGDPRTFDRVKKLMDRMDNTGSAPVGQQAAPPLFKSSAPIGDNGRATQEVVTDNKPTGKDINAKYKELIEEAQKSGNYSIIGQLQARWSQELSQVQQSQPRMLDAKF